MGPEQRAKGHIAPFEKILKKAHFSSTLHPKSPSAFYKYTLALQYFSRNPLNAKVYYLGTWTFTLNPNHSEIMIIMGTPNPYESFRK